MSTDECINLIVSANKKELVCPDNRYIKGIKIDKKNYNITCCTDKVLYNRDSDPTSNLDDKVYLNQSVHQFVWSNRTVFIMGFIIILLIMLIFLGKNLVTVILVILLLLLANVDVLGGIKKLLGSS